MLGRTVAKRYNISKDGKSVYVADDNTESEILTSSDHDDTWSHIQVTSDATLYPYSVAVAKEDPRAIVVDLTDFELTAGALFVSTIGFSPADLSMGDN